MKKIIAITTLVAMNSTAVRGVGNLTTGGK
jgi:hypothetical protein